MKKIRSFVLAFILTIMMAFNINADSFVANPVGAIPDGKEKIGQVLVIVEDTIESSNPSIAEPRGAIIDGQLVDLYESDTIMNLIVRAANEKEIEIEGAESNYIGGVDGLRAFDRGDMSGWMITLNDWFINAGGGDFDTSTTVTSSQGDLQDQDVIRVMYTLNYGEDLGGTWDTNYKTLEKISFSKGTLDKTFESDVHEYELTVAKGTDSILVTPTATNKNFQCRAFVDDAEKRFTRALDIEEGSVVEVTCGDPAWETMNWGSESIPAETYTFVIKYLDDKDEFVANPIGAIPDGKSKIGRVLVSVEDTLPGTPEPRGIIIKNEWVDLYETDTMFNVIVRAANQKEIEVMITDTEYGSYISAIDGLEEGHRGGWSGWTFSLNDWFLHLGISNYTTESTYTSPKGDLQDKDVIKVMYTLDWGDLGGVYGDNDKSLKNIKFNKGSLNKKFKSDVYEYELKVAKGTKSVLVTPTASNKNFQCRIFVKGEEYRRTQSVSIEEGSIISVTCGDPEWATMNYGSEQVDAKTYTFKVKYTDKQIIDEDKDENEEYGKLPLNGYDLSLLAITLLAVSLSGGTYFVLRRK